MKKEFIGPFKEYLKDYVTYKQKLGYKLSPAILKLREFDKYTKEKEIEELTIDVIYEFINNKDIKSSSKSSLASILRGFTKYLYRQNMITFVLPDKIYPRGERHKPYIFTSEEITKFFSSAKLLYPNCTFKNNITMLYFLLLYCTGMRAGECASLKFCDIDFNQNTITIFNTKNDIDRTIVINDDIKDIILKLKNDFNDMYEEDSYIFIKPNKERYSAKDFYAIFKKVIYYSKIGNNLHSPRMHDFRFTFCVKAYQKLIQLDKLEEYKAILSTYIGHKDFRSTEYYLTLVAELYPDIRKKAEDYTGNIIRELGDFDE